MNDWFEGLAGGLAERAWFDEEPSSDGWGLRAGELKRLLLDGRLLFFSST